MGEKEYQYIRQPCGLIFVGLFGGVGEISYIRVQTL